MRCDYPGCNQSAFWQALFEVPTLRFATTKQEFIKESKPTLLMDKRVICNYHKQNYDLRYWFPNHETWAKMQDVARSQGMKLDDLGLINVKFAPIAWKPSNRYMELERIRHDDTNLL